MNSRTIDTGIKNLQFEGSEKNISLDRVTIEKYTDKVVEFIKNNPQLEKIHLYTTDNAYDNKVLPAVFVSVIRDSQVSVINDKTNVLRSHEAIFDYTKVNRALLKLKEIIDIVKNIDPDKLPQSQELESLEAVFVSQKEYLRDVPDDHKKHKQKELDLLFSEARSIINANIIPQLNNYLQHDKLLQVENILSGKLPDPSSQYRTYYSVELIDRNDNRLAVEATKIAKKKQLKQQYLSYLSDLKKLYHDYTDRTKCILDPDHLKKQYRELSNIRQRGDADFKQWCMNVLLQQAKEINNEYLTCLLLDDINADILATKDTQIIQDHTTLILDQFQNGLNICLKNTDSYTDLKRWMDLYLSALPESMKNNAIQTSALEECKKVRMIFIKNKSTSLYDKTLAFNDIPKNIIKDEDIASLIFSILDKALDEYKSEKHSRESMKRADDLMSILKQHNLNESINEITNIFLSKSAPMTLKNQIAKYLAYAYLGGEASTLKEKDYPIKATEFLDTLAPATADYRQSVLSRWQGLIVVILDNLQASELSTVSKITAQTNIIDILRERILQAQNMQALVETTEQLRSHFTRTRSYVTGKTSTEQLLSKIADETQKNRQPTYELEEEVLKVFGKRQIKKSDKIKETIERTKQGEQKNAGKVKREERFHELVKNIQALKDEFDVMVGKGEMGVGQIAYRDKRIGITGPISDNSLLIKLGKFDDKLNALIDKAHVQVNEKNFQSIVDDLEKIYDELIKSEDLALFRNELQEQLARNKESVLKEQQNLEKLEEQLKKRNVFAETLLSNIDKVLDKFNEQLNLSSKLELEIIKQEIEQIKEDSINPNLKPLLKYAKQLENIEKQFSSQTNQTVYSPEATNTSSNLFQSKEKQEAKQETTSKPETRLKKPNKPKAIGA